MLASGLSDTSKAARGRQARAFPELHGLPVGLLVTFKQAVNRFGCGSTVTGRESPLL